MKQIFGLIVFLVAGILGFSPWINPKLVEYDFLIVPKNILLKKSPLVRSISDIQVHFVRGDVVVLRNETTNTEELKVDDVVKSGDIIYVRAHSWLVLRFGFGSRVKINANSVIKVDDLKKNLNEFDKDRINTFSLEAGSLYVDHPSISAKVSLRVKSRRSALGIRGTEFIVALDAEAQGLRVAVNHGLVELESGLKNHSVEVGSQKGASVTAKGVFEEPKEHKWVKKIHWDLEEAAFETPDQYEALLKSKAVEIRKQLKTDLEKIKTFVPQGAAVTNDNLDKKLDEEAAEQVTAAMAEAKKQTSNPDEISEEDLDELDLNFTRYGKNIPKINQGVLEAFAKKGMVPDKLKVAQETIKGVEQYNTERLKVLDEIDD